MTQTTVARWSRYLIYIILATLPLERIPSLELAEPFGVTVRLSQIAGLALIAINVPTLWRHRSDLVRGPWRWVVVFLAVAGASAVLAGDPKRGLLVWAYTMFVVVLAWAIARRVELGRLKQYATVLIASALATCAFGFYQFFGDLLGLSTTWTGLREQYTSKVFGFPRIQSTGLEPLYYDNFLLIPIGLIMAYLVLRRRNWALWGSLVIMATIICMNVSRGALAAMIGMAVVAVVLAAWYRRWTAVGAIGLAMITAVIMATGLISLGSEIAKQQSEKQQKAVQNFTKQVTNVNKGESARFRTISRDMAIQQWQEHPFLGVGPGNYGREAHLANPKKFADEKAIVNNEPLEILAETGLLGFLAFVVFVLSLLRLWFIRFTSRGLSLPERTWVLGLGLALLGTAAQYQTFSTLYITHIWVAIGILIGLLLVTRPEQRTQP
jgi:putative inorganic carbon (hco3(-)) transporter